MFALLATLLLASPACDGCDELVTRIDTAAAIAFKREADACGEDDECLQRFAARVRVHEAHVSRLKELLANGDYEAALAVVIDMNAETPAELSVRLQSKIREADMRTLADEYFAAMEKGQIEEARLLEQAMRDRANGRTRGISIDAVKFERYFRNCPEQTPRERG